MKRLNIWPVIFGIITIAIFQSGCGKANSSDRASADRVFTDQAGFTCFIIRDENGTAVGGNCIKE